MMKRHRPWLTSESNFGLGWREGWRAVQDSLTKKCQYQIPPFIPIFLLLAPSLLPWEERTYVCSVMGTTPRTRVRSSQQWSRDWNFSATGKDALGTSRKGMCQNLATRRSVVRGAMEHLASCKFTGIDRNKSSGADLTEENTSKRNPEKEDWTIPVLYFKAQIQDQSLP